MKPLFFNTLKGLTVFLLSAALLLTLLCFIALRFEEPSALVFVFSNVALLLSAFLGGRFSVNTENGRLLSGLILGVTATLIILLVSLIQSSFDGSSFLRMALTVLLAILGALSRKTRTKAPSSSRKRKSIAARYGSYR